MFHINIVHTRLYINYALQFSLHSKYIVCEVFKYPTLGPPHRISRYIECALGHVTGSIFTNLLPLLIRHIGFIYIVQSELSSNFCTNYPVTKLSSKFLVLVNFKTKNGFAFPTKVLWRVQLPL